MEKFDRQTDGPNNVWLGLSRVLLRNNGYNEQYVVSTLEPELTELQHDRKSKKCCCFLYTGAPEIRTQKVEDYK